MDYAPHAGCIAWRDSLCRVVSGCEYTVCQADPDVLGSTMVNLPAERSASPRAQRGGAFGLERSSALRATSDDARSATMRRGTATRRASRTIRKSPISSRAGTARSRCWRAGIGVATAALEARCTISRHRSRRPQGFASTAAFDLTRRGSMAAWLSAVVLLLAAVTCLLIYSLRRHRIDDFAGRIACGWRAALACLVLSVEQRRRRCISSWPTLCGHYTGWTALRDGAAWWLVLGGLPLAGSRCGPGSMPRDAAWPRRCLCAAIVCYGVVRWRAILGFVPVGRSASRSRWSLGARAAAWPLAAAGRRRIVCPVCRARRPGLDHQCRRRSRSQAEAQAAPVKKDQRRRRATTTRLRPQSRRFRQRLRLVGRPCRLGEDDPPNSSRWVDGSRPEPSATTTTTTTTKRLTATAS